MRDSVTKSCRPNVELAITRPTKLISEPVNVITERFESVAPRISNLLLGFPFVGNLYSLNYEIAGYLSEIRAMFVEPYKQPNASGNTDANADTYENVPVGGKTTCSCY
jgi:hypothetical protein